jgi:hypothetical protein
MSEKFLILTQNCQKKFTMLVPRNKTPSFLYVSKIRIPEFHIHGVPRKINPEKAWG